MIPTRKAYDLSAIVDKLEAPRHKPLARAIKAFHAAESVGVDLAAAAESVRLLKGLDKAISEETSHIGSALLVHAVVFTRVLATRRQSLDLKLELQARTTTR